MKDVNTKCKAVKLSLQIRNIHFAEVGSVRCALALSGILTLPLNKEFNDSTKKFTHLEN